MNFFKKKDKKLKSANPDINKSLLDAEAGIGLSNQEGQSKQGLAKGVDVNTIDISKEKPSESKKRKKDIKENYGWDFCLVLSNPDSDEFKEEPISPDYKPPAEILERLHLVGLETYQFYSGDCDEIFVKIRAPLHILRQHAQNVEYKMLLDSNYIKRHIENLKEPMGNDPNHTKLSPYDFIYASYNDGKCCMCGCENERICIGCPFSSIMISI